MALTDKLTAIADALRAKTGGTAQLTLDQIASGISGLDTSGSGGGVTLPANATSWAVGEWQANGTGTTASKSRCNYGKRMASGVTVTNNGTVDICVNAAYVASKSGSSIKIGTVSDTQTLTKNGGSYTFTNTGATYGMYLNFWTQITISGMSPIENNLNVQSFLNLANAITITGTEVS